MHPLSCDCSRCQDMYEDAGCCPHCGGVCDDPDECADTYYTQRRKRIEDGNRRATMEQAAGERARLLCLPALEATDEA